MSGKIQRQARTPKAKIRVEGEEGVNELVLEAESFCVFCLEHAGGNSEHPQTARLLDHELYNFFVVRELLGVSSRTSEDILEKFGNPSEWIKICWSCADMVKEAKAVYDKILELQRTLKVMQNDARNKLRRSRRSGGNLIGAAKQVRGAVLKSFKDASKYIEDDLKIPVKEERPLTPTIEDKDIIDFINEDSAHSFNLDSLSYTAEVEDNIPAETVNEDDDADDDWQPEDLDPPSPPPAKRRRTSLAGKVKRKPSKPSKRRKNSGIKRDAEGMIIVHKCHICTFAPTRRSDLLRHLRMIHGYISDDLKNIKRECDICALSFANYDELNLHKVAAHGMLKCPCCDKMFTERFKLKKHVKRYHLDDPLGMDLCNDNEGEEVINDRVLENSLTDGDSKKILKCSRCNFETDRVVLFNRHKKSVHWELPRGSRTFRTYECKQCDLKFKNISLYRQHCLNSHKMLACPLCPRLFENQNSLNRHMSYIHKKPKRLEKTAGMSTGEDKFTMGSGSLKTKKTKVNLKETNSSGQPATPTTDKEENDSDGNDQFKNEEILPAKKKRPPVKTFSCSWCNYQSNRAIKFNQHIIEVHGKPESGLNDQNRKCEHCDSTYDDGDLYREHCLKEHGVWSCKKCPRLFDYVGALKRHVMRIHDPLKHKSVDFSTEDWDDKEDLEKHIEPEDEIRGRFQCNRCEYFRSRVTRKVALTHIRTIHWKIPKIPKQLLLSTINCKCTVCDEIFRGGEALKEHCINYHKMSFCVPCNRLFPVKSKLDLHNAKAHVRRKPNPTPVPRNYKCSHCPKRFITQVGLSLHLHRSHWSSVKEALTLRKARKCPHCGLRFLKTTLFVQHSVEAHNLIQCIRCPRLFDSQSRLDNHLKQAHGDKSKSTLKKITPQAQAKADDTEDIEIEVDEGNSLSQSEEGPMQTLQCPYCTFCALTTKKAGLDNHLNKLHFEIVCRDKIQKGEEVSLRCEKCLVTSFKSLEDLMEHKTKVHDMVKCEICLHFLPALGYLNRHTEKYHSEETAGNWIQMIHRRKEAHQNRLSIKQHARTLKNPADKDKPPVIKCKDCAVETTFETKEELTQHKINEHPDKIYKCEKCPESETNFFDAMGKYYAHKVLVHNEPCDPYQCTQCDYTSTRYRMIEKHKLAVHVERAKMVCEICSKEYREERTLIWHKIREHGMDNETNIKFDLLQCKYCNRIFSSPYYLKSHIRNIHYKNSHYRCHVEGCGFGFGGQKQLDQHIRIKHKKEYRFPCLVKGCKKKFGTENQLRDHTVRVHEARQLKCDYCDYATNDKGWLIRHMEVHINAETKPFACEYCCSRFPSFRYLRQHYNSHIRSGQMDKSQVPTYGEYKKQLQLMD